MIKVFNQMIKNEPEVPYFYIEPKCRNIEQVSVTRVGDSRNDFGIVENFTTRELK